MKKKFVSIILCLVLIMSSSVSVYADSTAPTLSEITPVDGKTLLSSMTELECLEFIKSHGVEIPDDFEDETRWAPFVKQTIQQVEANPTCLFVYNYTVTLQFAEDIREVVNDYYSNNLPTSSTNSTNLTTTQYKIALEYSTKISDWNESYVDYNCYAYAINSTSQFYRPGEISGRTYSLSLGLDTLVNYVKYDLSAYGYPCIQVKTTRPTAGIDTDANAIAFRIGDVDFHFMKLNKSNGMWYHKPGGTAPLRYNSYPSIGVQWNNEALGRFNLIYRETTYYTSTIYYFVYAPHEYFYTYAGSGSHTVRCNDCDAYKFESCSPAGHCSKCGS